MVYKLKVKIFDDIYSKAITSSIKDEEINRQGAEGGKVWVGAWVEELFSRKMVIILHDSGNEIHVHHFNSSTNHLIIHV